MTDGGYVLPARLEPEPDESLPGLIMRYAALFPFKEPIRLFHQVSSSRREVSTRAMMDPSSPEARALGRALHLDEERLRRMSNWHPAPKCVSVAGNRVHEDLATIGLRQVCPECLRASAHHRQAWFLRAVPICPEHGKRLLHACPDCKEPLRWSGAGIAFCGNEECGMDLRDARAAPVTGRQAAAARGLLGLLDGRPHASGMEFGDALHAAIVLGGVPEGRFRLGRLTNAVRVLRDELPEVLANGWEALDPWPSAFHAFLEELKTRMGFEPGMALEQAFGELPRVLRRAAGRGWAAPLHAEMVAWAASGGGVTVRPDVLRRHGDAPERDWLTLNEAARLLGVSAEAMAVTAGRLSLDVAPVRRGVQRRLDTARVRALGEASALTGDLVTRREAAAMLGVSVPTLAQFTSLGIIPLLPRDQRVRQTHSIRRADVQAVLDAFARAAAAAPEVDDPGEEHRIIGAGSADRYGVIGIARAVLAGKVKPIAVCRQGLGLRRFLFPRVIRVSTTSAIAPASPTPLPERRCR